MTLAIDTLDQIANQFGAIVLDQWGVLHDGSAPYPHAVATLERLKTKGTRLAVLSNSGKRAAPNLDRIAGKGFDPDLFDTVMTSGEALWQDIAQGRATASRLYPVERAPGDAASWAEGLQVALVDRLDQADAVLLMGLPDGIAADAFEDLVEDVIARDLPILCTNPDRASPRAGGEIVISPGELAHQAAAKGAGVTFYGKPHAPVFRALETTLKLDPSRLLMVGDSLEHDIAGGHGAGWSTLFIRGGLHGAAFANGAALLPTVTRLAEAEDAPLPSYTLAELE